MAWYLFGDKPLSKPIMAVFGDAYMRHLDRPELYELMHVTHRILANMNAESLFTERSHELPGLYSLIDITYIAAGWWMMHYTLFAKRARVLR